MSDGEEKQGDAPVGGVLLDDETVNLLRNVAKRKGWKDRTPAQVAHRLAHEFILNNAIDNKEEKPFAVLDAAKLPDGNQKVGAADKPVPGSLMELLETEERREAEEERNRPKSPYPSLVDLAGLDEHDQAEGVQDQRTKRAGNATTPLERIQQSKTPKGPQSPDRK